MTKQPTLARTAPDNVFYYVQVCADRSEARAEMSDLKAKEQLTSFELVHVEPSQDEEYECEICVFVVYADKLPAFEPEDNLSALYTMPHLVDAPCYDIDDIDGNNTPLPNNLRAVD